MRRFIRPTLIAALSLALTSAIFAYATNYTLTQGSGTTFGSIVVGGVNYAQHMLCDLTTPSQCAAVSAGGAVKVDGSAVTAPVNVSQMGGTAINSGCVAALNGLTSAVPSTVCPWMGVYVINPTPLSYQTIANVTSVGFALDQVNNTTGNIVANNTTAVVVNAAATTLYGVQVYGIGSAPAYLKLYNATSATCGSGTPVKRLMIPAASTAANGAGSNVSFGAAGLRFNTGLTYCVTTGITDADTTAPAASTFLVNLDWH